MNFPVKLQTITIGEIAIELFVPESNFVKQAYHEGTISFPYWSKIWPAAIALSKFMVRHPHYLQNKRLAELGAGLGLPSLLAARYASSVLCTDYVAEAVIIAQQSAAHNSLTNFTAAVVNWHHLTNDFEAEVLLLSDVNYEPVIFDELLQLVKKFLNGGSTIVLSTPQRLMAKDFIAPLVANTIQQEEIIVEHEGQVTTITVLVLIK